MYSTIVPWKKNGIQINMVSFKMLKLRFEKEGLGSRWATEKQKLAFERKASRKSICVCMLMLIACCYDNLFHSFLFLI